MIDFAVGAADRKTKEDVLTQKLFTALHGKEIRREVDFNSVINLHEFNCRMHAENMVIQAKLGEPQTETFTTAIRKYYDEKVAPLAKTYKTEVAAYESAADQQALPRKAAQEAIAQCKIMEDKASEKINEKKQWKYYKI